MRSNTKVVRSLVKAHILDTIESVETLKANLKAVGGTPNTQTTYQQAKYLVEGGAFLVYYQDIKEFLNGLGINPNNKEYSNSQSWDLYRHLIASEIVKIVENQLLNLNK
jgi:hypothetical protein